MDRKKFQYTDEELEKMSNLFKILSEPSRLKIIRVLFNGEKCVTDICNETNLLQANVSKQLRILSRAKVITGRTQGVQRYYRITDLSVAGICSKVCAKDNF